MTKIIWTKPKSQRPNQNLPTSGSSQALQRELRTDGYW